jgi:hypothetical protein
MGLCLLISFLVSGFAMSIISFIAFITQYILLIHLQLLSILIVKAPHHTYISHFQALTYFS